MKWGWVPTALILAIFVPRVASAQTDSLQLKSGKLLRGRVVDTDKTKLSFQTRNGTSEVRIDDIKLLTFYGQPNELQRARNHLANGRYGDCLKEIGKIDEEITIALVKAEIEFYRVAAMANDALSHGSTTRRTAVTEVTKFVSDYPKSIHFMEMTDLYGRLAMESGEFSNAESAFQQMANVEIPKIKIDGLIGLGRSQLAQGKYRDAANNLALVQRVDSNDDVVRTAKLMARCLQARVLAADNKPAEAIKQLQDLIKREDADNGPLFAAAYNALGFSQMKAGDSKQALMAYLHTNLLYHTESEMDAEALFNLASIWSSQNETDRANRARQSLKTKYRNSYWTSKL